MNDPVFPLPSLGPSIPRRKYTSLEKWIGRLVMRSLRFTWTGGFPNRSRMVLIAAPHTSNWDAVIGLAAIAILGLRLTVYGKSTLFFPPLGWLLRRFGAIPIHRESPGGIVDRALERFGDGRPFLLGMTPEGTRSKAAEWKTGFHRVAVDAEVPVAVIGIDWKLRRIGVLDTIEMSGDLQRDLGTIGGLLADIRGLRPAMETLPNSNGQF